MSPHPLPPIQHEPLTADERAWAEQLRRIGPHDGPSPALDARILAAARAAVAPRPHRHATRRRWPTLVGAAASLVIVVGLAWQLQPMLRSRPSLDEGPVAAAPIPRSEGSLSADVLAAADPVARRAVASPPPPPPPPLPTLSSATRKQANAPPAIVPAPAPAALPAPTQRPSAFGDDAIPPYADYAEKATARQAAAQAAANDAGARASTEPRRERAAALAPQAFPAASAKAEAGAAMPAPAPPAAATSAPTARRDFAPAEDASAAAAESPSSASKAGSEHDNTTLDRIEVSGTRIDLAELPVRDDARLPPVAWLQRIRDRRDGDDLDGARASLALFRESHPRVRLPDDLTRLDR